MKINSNITKAEQTFVAVQAIIEFIQNQLEHMHLGFGVCTFLLPIVYPNEQAKNQIKELHISQGLPIVLGMVSCK
jgi:hypothetical protein